MEVHGRSRQNRSRIRRFDDHGRVLSVHIRLHERIPIHPSVAERLRHIRDAVASGALILGRTAAVVDRAGMPPIVSAGRIPGIPHVIGRKNRRISIVVPEVVVMYDNSLRDEEDAHEIPDEVVSSNLDEVRSGDRDAHRTAGGVDPIDSDAARVPDVHAKSVSRECRIADQDGLRPTDLDGGIGGSDRSPVDDRAVHVLQLHSAGHMTGGHVRERHIRAADEDDLPVGRSRDLEVAAILAVEDRKAIHGVVPSNRVAPEETSSLLVIVLREEEAAIHETVVHEGEGGISPEVDAAPLERVAPQCRRHRNPDRDPGLDDLVVLEDHADARGDDSPERGVPHHVPADAQWARVPDGDPMTVAGQRVVRDVDRDAGVQIDAGVRVVGDIVPPHDGIGRRLEIHAISVISDELIVLNDGVRHRVCQDAHIRIRDRHIRHSDPRTLGDDELPDRCPIDDRRGAIMVDQEG